MHDTIVVGAGPAGSAAAAVLAQRGRDVLLLDRATFPRPKVCGDGISNRAIAELEAIGAWEKVQAARFRPTRSVESVAPSGGSVAVDLTSGQSHHRGVVAPRHQFDALLKDHATARGATFRVAEVVAPIVEQGRVRGIMVRGGGGGGNDSRDLHEVRAAVVIAADGAYSVLAKKLREYRALPFYRSVAVRGYVETEHPLDYTTLIYYGRNLLPGYAWIFPVSDHLANVGLGTTEQRRRKLRRPLRSFFDTFLQSPEVRSRFGAVRSVREVQGWVMNLGGSDDFSRVFPGLLLTGDAGAFVNPVTGAGIAAALATGRLAAEVVDEALAAGPPAFDEVLRDYDRRWYDELAIDLKRAYMVQRLLLLRPEPIDMFNLIARLVPGTGVLMNDILESFAGTFMARE